MFLVLASVLVAGPVNAQSHTDGCSTRDDVRVRLLDGYSESVIAGGIAANGGTVEVLASPHGETWTVLFSMPGESCLVATGENWVVDRLTHGTGRERTIPLPPRGRGVPSLSDSKQACTERPDAVADLSSNYAEAPVARGVANNGRVLEVLASRSGKSWSILVTTPGGVACLLATGENWMDYSR